MIKLFNRVIFIILFLLTFAVAACTPNVTINYNLPTTVIPGAIETYAIQTMLAKPELVSLVITPTPTQLHTNPSPTSIKDNINQTAANQGILNQNDAEYHQQLITQTPNPTATPLEPCNAVNSLQIPLSRMTLFSLPENSLQKLGVSKMLVCVLGPKIIKLYLQLATS